MKKREILIQILTNMEVGEELEKDDVIMEVYSGRPVPKIRRQFDACLLRVKRDLLPSVYRANRRDVIIREK
jgi:hypothetical protein